MTVFEPLLACAVLAFSFQGIMVSAPPDQYPNIRLDIGMDRPGCKPEPNVFLALGKNTVERAEGLSLYRANKSVEETGNGSVPGIGSAQAEAEAMPAIAPVREYGVAKRPSGPKEGVNWRGLAQQSGLFLGVQHAFRLATEPGTREGLKGPFWKGYAQAVGNLHGWSDGDPYYVNYLGHPLEGAVAGFIWIGNDRDYRKAEFGRSTLYWKSRLRAAAFALAYSQQFEIGPFSEASIGKIQNYHPQQGFADHVITPLVGLGWLVAEDALDRYVIKRFEEKVDNHYLQLFTRGLLNPARSFSNMMRLQGPWVRDTRPQLWSGHLKEYLKASKQQASIPEPKRPKRYGEGEFGVPVIEVTAGFRSDFFPDNGGLTTCLGTGAEASVRVQAAWRLVADVSGCRIMGLSNRWTGDELSYFGGARWTPRPSSRWSPYAHLLLGGTNVTAERDRTGVRELSTAEVVTSNRFAMKVGGGADLRVNPALAVRVANLEYKHAWGRATDSLALDHGLSLTMGLVLRFGTW
jgi:hypothetical protein